MANWPRISRNLKKLPDMCFACGKDNPIGLKMKFYQDGKKARAEFTPSKLHQGWSEIVHGGIIAAMLDEAVSYATLFAGIDTVTAKMEMRFRCPIPIDEPVSITGDISKRTRKLIEARATIFLKDGTVAAESTSTHFIFGSQDTEGE